MSGPSNYQPKSAFGKWMHERLPIMELVQGQALDFPTPKNLNYWWTFGGILAVMLVAQLITGIVLAMHYTPHVSMAFELGRAHHARREFRLAAALPACQRRIDVFHRRLHPYFPRHVLRLLQGATRSSCG